MSEIGKENKIAYGVLYDSIISFSTDETIYLKIAIKVKDKLISFNIPEIKMEDAKLINKILKDRCLTSEKAIIKCIVTGECPFCKEVHDNTETVLIQVNGRLFSLENSKGFGFAQCINCLNPLPYKKDIILNKESD